MRNTYHKKEGLYKHDAIELVKYRVAEREAAMKRVREIREVRVTNPGVFTQKELNDLCRSSLMDVPSLMPSKLEKERQENLEYGSREFGPIILDDGYACCGLEDARCEDQHWAREHAKVLHLVLHILK